MDIIHHDFPQHRNTFAVVRPRDPNVEYFTKFKQYRVVSINNPRLATEAVVIEVMTFGTGEMNRLHGWLSHIMFDCSAQAVINRVLAKYPETKKTNEFEIWILTKIK